VNICGLTETSSTLLEKLNVAVVKSEPVLVVPRSIFPGQYIAMLEVIARRSENILVVIG
jgi:hypothetical protein